MTNGELFIKENPNIEYKLNGTCVWIYFDGVNHYTMPTLWWEQEISLFDKIRAEIGRCKTQHEMQIAERGTKSKLLISDIFCDVIKIIDKYMGVME